MATGGSARTLGIDPGATGALVLLEGGQPIEWMTMPTIKVGKGSRVNGAALSAVLRQYDASHVFVEHVGAMPGQTGMFAFGHACGTVMGALAALELPHTLVVPQVWKRRAGLGGTDKDAARTRAIQLWPAWRELDAKGKGQALADAALIAKFGEAA